MTDTCSLHDNAVKVKPKEEAKPSTIWVAVLHAHKQPNGNNGEEDWLWIKCHGRIPAQTIRDQYAARSQLDEEWVLKHESKVLANLQAAMYELDTYHDRVIAFEAVRASDASRLVPTRQPLQPKTNQTFSPPPKQNHTLRVDGAEDVKPLTVPERQATQPGTHDENSVRQPDIRPQNMQAFQDHTRYTTSPRPLNTHQPASYSPKPSYQQPPYNPYVDNLSPKRTHRSSPTAETDSRSAAIRHASKPRVIDPASPATRYGSPAGQGPMSPSQNLSLPAVLDPNDRSVNMASFYTFYESSQNRVRAAYPNYTDAEIYEFIRRQWEGISPALRAEYEARASDIPGSHGMDGQPPVPGDKSAASPSTAHSVKQEPQVDTKSIANHPVVEPPISSSEIDQPKPKNFQLQALLKEAGPHMLESSVEEGVKLLDQLKAPSVAKLDNNPDADQWIKQIDDLRKQAVKTRTVIGVVGNTGAGKSSVINAMLDEERLVPTNCMRACTAVVTELSYNYEEEPYRAQIEFISSAEWEKELKTLFQDLLDGNGQVSRECANEDTDAGIAYAKIKAVYPRKTKEDIANTNIATMLREVSSILGSSREIKEKDALLFHKKLQHFVDSKEKSTGKMDKDKKKERREMEFWPLIRVVRIHVKSPALATGAVIVDLPGVHDANAARAAVAEGYMKQCTGLWIVAPINRAVDDKAAKSLLGESFKRQLKMDGGFNSVTFICSKTDDISLEEAQDSLGLDDEMAPDWAELDQLVKKQKSIEKRLEDLKDSKTVYGEVMNDVDEQIEVWDALKDELEEGKTVFPPKPKETAKKRKRDNKEEKQRKRSRKAASSEDEESGDSDFEDQASDDDEENNAALEDESEEREPLTREQIAVKLQDLRSTKKEARQNKAEIAEQITALRKESDEAKVAEEKIESKMSVMCISGRNQYSKGAIQQDFAAGIKELDQELAAEEDEENFNPDTEARDYDEVARGLPVFCVSSRGYQKLQGRLRKDPHIPGFTSIEETEIPQLQAHCEKLTETGRTANCRTFINKLSQLLNSMTLWASSDGTGANLTAEQRAREARYLQKGLETLESGLENAVKTVSTELSDEFADNIFDKYETAVSNATNDAIDTAQKWGSPVNREDRAAGGLCWSTYKAICRRNGIYTNAQGPHEWNVQLAEPMLKIVASGWEKTFARRLPMVMAAFSRNSAAPLRTFHRDIEARARKLGSNIAGLSMLQHQVSTYESILKDLSASVKETINTAQKDINREFIPVIERAMITAYEECVAERGPGSFARMKAHMYSHVAHERHIMFQESADNVERRLKEMLKHVEELMSDKTDEVFTQMRRDYRSIIGGGDIPQDGQMLPKDQRLARKGVMKVIQGVEKAFMKVAGLITDEEDDDKENYDPARHSNDEDEGGQAPSIKEEARDPDLEREDSPSDQLSRDEAVRKLPVAKFERAVSEDNSMADTASDKLSDNNDESDSASVASNVSDAASSD